MEILNVRLLRSGVSHTVAMAMLMAVLTVATTPGRAQTEPSGEKRPPQAAAEKIAPGPPEAEPAGPNVGAAGHKTANANAKAPVTDAFQNGVLTSAPATSKDVDTAPAKFSAQNDAADKLPVVAYTFRDLTPEQRQAVFDAVTGGDGAVSADASSVPPELGAEVPNRIAQQQLKPMPKGLSEQMPRLAKMRYMRSGDLVLAVEPNNNIVVGVFTKDGSVPPSATATTAATDPKGANDAPPATAAPGSH